MGNRPASPTPFSSQAMTTTFSNREEGKTFELIFERQCKLSGLWVEQNHLKAKRGYKGRLIAMESNLDFTVVDKGGRVGFFDCKSFDGESFKFSEIPPHQLDLATRYNDWKVPAGFVVWFREVDRVVFFSGAFLRAVGGGNSLCWSGGVQLGKWSRFDITIPLTPSVFCSS